MLQKLSKDEFHQLMYIAKMAKIDKKPEEIFIAKNELESIQIKNKAFFCEEFIYNGDVSTIGARWVTWLDRFHFHLQANRIIDKKSAKASFLILIGPKALEIYRSKKKSDHSESLAEIEKLMTTHFVETTVCTFKMAFRNECEHVSDYAMRLRHGNTYCNHETEIQNQFVVKLENTTDN